MSLLGRRKKVSNSQVCWRDSSGLIRCLGDNCAKKKCDDSCPIWLNSEAVFWFNNGEFDKTIKLCEQAILIAPDFPDLYINKGSAHGALNQYQLAHDSFQKAYELNPDKANALLGLAMSSRNLKLYDECIGWCDKYDSKFSDSRCDKIRDEVNKILKSSSDKNDKTDTLSAMDICAELLHNGKIEGFIEDDTAFPNIPEIACQAKSIVIQLQNGFKELSGNQIDPTLIPAWATLAGMGAVRAWNDDWNKLKENGIYSSLTDPRGLEEMDEYVLDYIGWEWGSSKSEKFLDHLHDIIDEAYVLLFKYNNGTIRREDFINISTAFFYYGMIIEMNELGMK